MGASQKQGVGIAAKLILVNAALLAVVVGVFGLVTSLQSRRTIDEHARLQQAGIIKNLRQAGTSELRLLARAVRVALLQNDYVTVQTIVRDLGEHDDRLTAIAVVDTTGTILAHKLPQLLGTQATGVLQRSLLAHDLRVEPDVKIGGERSMVFYMPVSMMVESGTTHEMQLGSVVTAFSLRPAAAKLEEAEQLKRREARANLRNILVLGMLSVALGIVLTVIQGLRLSGPVHALAQQAGRMADGDLTARVDVATRDEIGMLGHRFNHMATQIETLVEETKAKAAMEKELEVAKAVQATLVPAARVVEAGGLVLAGYFKPAAQCGGDWWSYYDLSQGRVMVVIGDVTGHGVAPAMITAAVKGAATTVAALTRGQIVLPDLLRMLNMAIHDAAKGSFAMTLFASIYDRATRTLTYANAGHNAPYVFSAPTGVLSSLALASDRLGDSPTSEYEARSLTLAPDDALFWFTDGLVECENVHAEEYGDRRLQEIIRQSARLAPEDAVDKIVGEARSFYGEVPQKDDITLVVGRSV